MQHEEEFEDDWKAEAPLLASLSKNAEPEVPEGYFEGLQSNVLARIKALDSTTEPAPITVTPQAIAGPTGGKVIGFSRRILWTAVASIALLVATGTYFLTRPTKGLDTGFAEVTLDEATLLQLAGLESTTLVSELDPSHVNDEELFAMLGSEAATAFSQDENAVQRDDAYEYLQDVDLDAIDLQGLDIDLSDLN